MSVALTKQERFWCCIDMKHLAKICIFITPFVAEAAFAQDLAPATPESQGVSSRAILILRWIEECETTAATNGFRGGFLHGFVIVRHGKNEGGHTPQMKGDNEGGHTPQNAHFTGLSAISTL